MLVGLCTDLPFEAHRGPQAPVGREVFGNLAIDGAQGLLHITDAKDAFHSELYAAVKPQIASLYLKKWRENLSWATKTFTNEEEGGERRIRTRAGMPDSGPLPEPKLGE